MDMKQDMRCKKKPHYPMLSRAHNRVALVSQTRHRHTNARTCTCTPRQITIHTHTHTHTHTRILQHCYKDRRHIVGLGSSEAKVYTFSRPLQEQYAAAVAAQLQQQAQAMPQQQQWQQLPYPAAAAAGLAQAPAPAGAAPGTTHLAPVPAAAAALLYALEGAAFVPAAAILAPPQAPAQQQQKQQQQGIQGNAPGALMPSAEARPVRLPLLLQSCYSHADLTGVLPPLPDDSDAAAAAGSGGGTSEGTLPALVLHVGQAGRGQPLLQPVAQLPHGPDGAVPPLVIICRSNKFWCKIALGLADAAQRAGQPTPALYLFAAQGQQQGGRGRAAWNKGGYWARKYIPQLRDLQDGWQPVSVGLSCVSHTCVLGPARCWRDQPHFCTGAMRSLVCLSPTEADGEQVDPTTCFMVRSYCCRAVLGPALCRWDYLFGERGRSSYREYQSWAKVQVRSALGRWRVAAAGAGGCRCSRCCPARSTLPK